MDWFIISGVVVAGWAILAVLSAERHGRYQQLASAMAERAKAASEVPVASAASVWGSTAVFNKTR